MSSVHWLILFPYYFFGALTSLLFLILAARLVRARLSSNALVLTAVLVGVVATLLPLVAGWVRLSDYGVVNLFLLAGSSFVLALLDASLQPRLPIALDAELEQL